jgi:hypothetical protein
VSALRVELAQDGVVSVDVVGPVAPVDHDAALALVAIETPCGWGASELGIDVHNAATSKSVQQRLTLYDVDVAARPRMIALAIAEILRDSWAGLALADAPAASAPKSEPERGVPSPPPSIRPAAATSAAARTGTAATPSVGEVAPSGAPVSPPRTFLAVALEGRVFPSYSTGLLGPRAELSLPVVRHIPVRLRADAGAAFGSAHDPLGDVDMALASGGVALTYSAEGPFLRSELGPKIEVGWATAQGVPMGATVEGSRANAAVVTASILAAISTHLRADWWSALAVEVGGTTAGLDARADMRRAAGVGGLMLGVRLGVAYAL